MTFIAREEQFTCEHCNNVVSILGGGTYRDHCPLCLTSKHVDRDGPGDRLSECQGLLQPIGIEQSGKKGFLILYECERCKKKCRNKAAPDDQLIEFLENKE